MPSARRFCWKIAIVLVGGFCGLAIPVQSADPSGVGDAGDCWWPRIAIVLAAASGTAPKDVDIGQAINFLEANTGIRSNLQMSFAGYAIDKPVLRRSLKRWVGWLIEHYPYLYWDAERRLFAIDTDAERRGAPTGRPTAPQDGKCDPIQPTLEQLFEPTAAESGH